MPTIEQSREAGAAAIAKGNLVPANPMSNGPVPIPTPPSAPTLNPQIRTPLPASYVQQPDMQRQWHNTATVQSRIPPLAITSNPVAGAQAASQAAAVIAAPTTETVAITLEMPGEFTVTGSPVGAEGTLDVAWTPEAAGTVFSGPASSGVSSYVDASNFKPANAGSVTVTATANQADLALVLFAAGGSGLSLPSGFTNINTAGNTVFAMAKVSAGTVSVSDSYTVSGTAAIAGALALFPYSATAALPTVVQQGAISGAFGQPSVSCLGQIPTGTQFLIVNVTGGSATTAPGGFTNFGPVTDSLGNTYLPIGRAVEIPSSGVLDNAAIVAFYLCVNPISSPTVNSVTFSLAIAPNPPNAAGWAAASFSIYSVNGFTQSEAIPTFKQLSSLLTAAVQYQTVENHGTALPQESHLNFLAPLNAADNPGNLSTDVNASVFVASGASHASGIVPDPGAVAGTTHFLREDATWAVPPGSGGTGVPPFPFWGNTTSYMPNTATGFTKNFGWDNNPSALGSFFNSVTTSTTTNLVGNQYQTAGANAAAGAMVNNGSGFWAFDYFGGLNFTGECSISRTTDVRFYDGLFNNSSIQTGIGGSTVAASVNGAYFRFDTTAGDATNWKCVTCDGTTRNVIDSGVAVDTNTHRFTVLMNGTTNAKFYIDGTLVATSTTNLPTGSAEWQMSVSWATTQLHITLTSAIISQ